MPDIDTFSQYNELANQLIAHSTKEEIAEAARLLALNVAHYQIKFGELPLDERLAMLNMEKPNVQQLEMLVAGMQALVGVLGMIRMGDLEKDNLVH
jgi:hypothetical protein